MPSQRYKCAVACLSSMLCAPESQCSDHCYSCGGPAGAGKCEPGGCELGYGLRATGTCAPVRRHQPLAALCSHTQSALCLGEGMSDLACMCALDAVCGQLPLLPSSRGWQARCEWVFDRLQFESQWLRTGASAPGMGTPARVPIEHCACSGKCLTGHTARSRIAVWGCLQFL